jgi:hypothetical protein
MQFTQKSEALFINEFLKSVNNFLQNKLYTIIDKKSGMWPFFLHRNEATHQLRHLSASHTVR